MQTMTEEEARTIMKSYGWFYVKRRPKGVAEYVYAKKRKGPRMMDYYICPLSQLENLTEDELVAKLTTEPAQDP